MRKTSLLIQSCCSCRGRCVQVAHCAALTGWTPERLHHLHLTVSEGLMNVLPHEVKLEDTQYVITGLLSHDMVNDRE